MRRQKEKVTHLPVDALNLQRENESLDMLKGSTLSIFQKKDGYRFSIDSILLADFVKIKKSSEVAELGSGSAVVSLIIASRFKNVHITGIDIQESIVDMARRNVRANKLESRISIIHGNINRIQDYLAPQSYDAVICNPPYRKASSGRVSMRYEKAIARHEMTASIRDFCRAANLILKDGGWYYVIFPARRVAQLIVDMKRAHIEPKRMRTVYSIVSSAAEFVLVGGVKKGGEELEIMPPLYLYREPGVYTDEIVRLFENLTHDCEISW